MPVLREAISNVSTSKRNAFSQLRSSFNERSLLLKVLDLSVPVLEKGAAEELQDATFLQSNTDLTMRQGNLTMCSTLLPILSIIFCRVLMPVKLIIFKKCNYIHKEDKSQNNTLNLDNWNVTLKPVLQWTARENWWDLYDEQKNRILKVQRSSLLAFIFSFLQADVNLKVGYKYRLLMFYDHNRLLIKCLKEVMMCIKMQNTMRIVVPNIAL